MDQQQAQNVNQAAQEWTEAVRLSFQTLADRTVTLQESNLKLTQSFFQQFVEQFQSQTQGNEQATQSLQQQGERQQQAFETLSQESANAYSQFLNSALSFYQQTLQQATQVAQSNMQTAGQVARAAHASSETLAGEPRLSEYAGLGGMEEGEATALSLELVRRARDEQPEREVEGEAPSPNEVRELFSLGARSY